MDREIRAALARLGQLRGRVPRQIIKCIAAQIHRGELEEAAKGMAKWERRAGL